MHIQEKCLEFKIRHVQAFLNILGGMSDGLSFLEKCKFMQIKDVLIYFDIDWNLKYWSQRSSLFQVLTASCIY